MDCMSYIVALCHLLSPLYAVSLKDVDPKRAWSPIALHLWYPDQYCSKLIMTKFTYTATSTSSRGRPCVCFCASVLFGAAFEE